MSYRTFVNDFQIFENNEYNKELIAELNRQGADIKENDDCYSFEIKDINPIIKIVDDYIKEKVDEVIKQYQNPYDLTFFWNMRDEEKPLYERIDNCIYFGTIFQSYRFMEYLYNNRLIEKNFIDGTHTILKKIVISGG